MKMDKADKLLSTGCVLISVSLIMWETFGFMIAPTALTVAASGCFVAAGLCMADKAQNKARKRKRR